MAPARCCALLLADSEAARQYGLIPRARIIGMARAGVAPRVMGIGPAPAVQKLLRQFGLRDDDPRVNPNGGAIALGIGNSRD
jgi:acetyl-CoA C-acetyltransferase